MNSKDSRNYDDIIRLPHHVSRKHPQMSLPNRAAQFTPFAALTGHGAAIQETARLTETFIELNEDQKEQLNEQLKRIQEQLPREPEIEITYFQPDLRKNGGTYVTARKRVTKIDLYSRKILFTDGTGILMEEIFAVDLVPEPE